MRKRNSLSLRYLDALNSPAYAQVSHELRVNASTQALDSITQANVLQAVFGIAACDPDLDGEPFELGLLPSCPSCGETISASWRMTEPIEFVEMEVPPATFSVWRNLSDKNCKKRVMQILQNYLEVHQAT